MVTKHGKRNSLLRETETRYENAKPQHLERVIAACEKPHSAFWNSQKEQRQRMSLLKSIISAILILLQVTSWDV